MPISHGTTSAKEQASGFTLWLTGVPGVGKTTLARGFQQYCSHANRASEVLDGDELRATFDRELGFSRADRDRHVLRLGHIARLLSRNNVVAIVAAVSPYRETRDAVKRLHEARFVEVYVRCQLDELMRRDTKQLYSRATRGEIEHLTGISDPYEPPLEPDVVIDTDRETVAASLSKIVEWCKLNGYPNLGP